MSGPLYPPGRDINALPGLPFKVRGHQQWFWAFGSILLGVAAVALAGHLQIELGAENAIQAKGYLELGIPGPVFILVGVRLLFRRLLVNEAGVVVTNVFWRYRIAWSELRSVEVVCVQGDEGPESRLRFDRGPGRRRIVAGATVRDGWNDEELVKLAAQLQMLRDRFGSTTGASARTR